MSVGLAERTASWTALSSWFAGHRRARPLVQLSNPPMRQIAADLGRLLREHDMFARSEFTPIRGWRLRLLEAAITDRATQAAHALGLPDLERPAYGSFDHARLGRLLQELATRGLALPPAGLVAARR